MHLQELVLKATATASSGPDSHRHRLVRRFFWPKEVHCYCSRVASLSPVQPQSCIPTGNDHYPFVFLTLYQGDKLLFDHWVPSLEDLLADDWENYQKES